MKFNSKNIYKIGLCFVVLSLFIFFVGGVQAKVGLPDFSKINDLGSMMENIYSFSITVIGIIIFIRFLYGGFLYLTAAANPSGTSRAKGVLQNAIIGAVILFSAYLILYVINPDLVSNSFDFGQLTGQENSSKYVGTPTKIENFNVVPKTASISGKTMLTFTLKFSGSTSYVDSKCGQSNSAIEYKVTQSFGSQTGLVRIIDGWASDFSGGGIFSKDFQQELYVGGFNNPAITAGQAVQYKVEVLCSSGASLNVSAPVSVTVQN